MQAVIVKIVKMMNMVNSVDVPTSLSPQMMILSSLIGGLMTFTFSPRLVAGFVTRNISVNRKQ